MFSLTDARIPQHVSDLVQLHSFYKESVESGEVNKSNRALESLCIELFRQILESHWLHYFIPKEQITDLGNRLSHLLPSAGNLDFLERIRTIANITIPVVGKNILLMPLLSPHLLNFILSFFTKDSPLMPKIKKNSEKESKLQAAKLQDAINLTLLVNVDVACWEKEQKTNDERSKRMVQLLDLRRQEIYETHPLDPVAEENEYETIQNLLRVGASVEACDSAGRTALMFCGNERVAKLLVEHNANVNTKDVLNGHTALHYAVLKDRFGVLEFLASAPGIALDKCSNKKNQRRTAIDLAITIGNTRAIAVLQKHGATHGRQDTVDELVAKTATAVSLMVSDRLSERDALALAKNEKEPKKPTEKELKQHAAEKELKQKAAEARKRMQSAVFYLEKTPISDWKRFKNWMGRNVCCWCPPLPACCRSSPVAPPAAAYRSPASATQKPSHTPPPDASGV
ncbi:MAG: ankyrin repeat domain-containing protein [Parachlamydiaceae bacterium]|nr:ankyrin repeat domain-containing protein [Parachlamydiaceae bacterium]